MGTDTCQKGIDTASDTRCWAGRGLVIECVEKDMTQGGEAKETLLKRKNRRWKQKNINYEIKYKTITEKFSNLQLPSKNESSYTK